MSVNVCKCPYTYSLLLGIIYMQKLPLSDLHSLFPQDKSNTTTSTPIKERAFVVYGRNGTYSANGRRVAAQPYLIVEEITLYFFLISILKYVLRQKLYMQNYCKLIQGKSNIFTLELIHYHFHRYELTLHWLHIEYWQLTPPFITCYYLA